MIQVYRTEEIQKKSKDIAEFLHVYLGKYGDPLEAISLAIDHAARNDGFVIVAEECDTMKGALVVNTTGMTDYVPSALLVYVAVAENMRGRGIGKQLVEKAVSLCDGDISLHVEYDNPAIRLYERLGFSLKYAEMRFTKAR